jgi:hypothetical protein
MMLNSDPPRRAIQMIAQRKLSQKDCEAAAERVGLLVFPQLSREGVDLQVKASCFRPDPTTQEVDRRARQGEEGTGR